MLTVKMEYLRVEVEARPSKNCVFVSSDRDHTTAGSIGESAQALQKNLPLLRFERCGIQSFKQ